MLSLNNQALQYLIKDEFKKFYDPKYPLFYKNKIQKGKFEKQKFFYRNPIDTALKHDQAKSVQEIIEYVVKYQNNWVSSFLFKNNLHDIIERGLPVILLLESNIFRVEFDFDEWPSTHTNSK